jgi:hypothetical protein
MLAAGIATAAKEFLLLLRQRPGDFARAIDKKLGHWA